MSPSLQGRLCSCSRWSDGLTAEVQRESGQILQLGYSLLFLTLDQICDPSLQESYPRPSEILCVSAPLRLAFQVCRIRRYIHR
jgi:hypothetical protein